MGRVVGGDDDEICAENVRRRGNLRLCFGSVNCVGVETEDSDGCRPRGLGVCHVFVECF